MLAWEAVGPAGGKAGAQLGPLTRLPYFSSLWSLVVYYFFSTERFYIFMYSDLSVFSFRTLDFESHLRACALLRSHSSSLLLAA